MGIELRNSDFSGVFWGLGTVILRLTTVGVNHSANLPDLHANYSHKLVYKLIKVYYSFLLPSYSFIYYPNNTIIPITFTMHPPDDC